MTPGARIRCVLTARDTGARLTEQPSLAPVSGGSGLPTVTVRHRRRVPAHRGLRRRVHRGRGSQLAGAGRRPPPAGARGLFRSRYAGTAIRCAGCTWAAAISRSATTPTPRPPTTWRSRASASSATAGVAAVHPRGAAGGGRADQAARLAVEPAGVDEDDRPDERRRPAASGCRRAWARCYVRFIEAYAAEGVPIWGVSVQNEPAATQRWDSCLYTAEEERDFVRDYLGPELEAAGLGRVRIVIWDHNRDLMVERATWSTRTPRPRATCGAPGSTGTARTASITSSRSTTPGPTSSCCSRKAARKAARITARGNWASDTRAR